MKILQIVTVLDPQQSYGGPASVAVQQLHALNVRKHSVLLVAAWGAPSHPPQIYDGIPIRAARARPLVARLKFSSLISLRVVRIIKDSVKDADVVHVHFARDAIPLVGAILALAFRKPLYLQTHGMVVPDGRILSRVLDRLIVRPAMSRADSIFSLSTVEDRRLGVLIDSESTNVQRLRNGVRVADSESANAIRQDVPRPAIDVLFLARLHPRKRVADFLSAAQIILADPELSNVKFSVVGPDEGDASLVKEAARVNAVGGGIHYEGPLAHEHVIRRIAKADIYVLPSENEPFPMSVLEALACGTPTVISDGCHIGDDLSSAGAVVTFPVGDIDALAKELRTLIGSPADRQTLGKNGWRYAEAELSIESVADQLEKAYMSRGSSS